MSAPPANDAPTSNDPITDLEVLEYPQKCIDDVDKQCAKVQGTRHHKRAVSHQARTLLKREMYGPLSNFGDYVLQKATEFQANKFDPVAICSDAERLVGESKKKKKDDPKTTKEISNVEAQRLMESLGKKTQSIAFLQHIIAAEVSTVSDTCREIGAAIEGFPESELKARTALFRQVQTLSEENGTSMIGVNKLLFPKETAKDPWLLNDLQGEELREAIVNYTKKGDRISRTKPNTQKQDNDFCTLLPGHPAFEDISNIVFEKNWDSANDGDPNVDRPIIELPKPNTAFWNRVRNNANARATCAWSISLFTAGTIEMGNSANWQYDLTEKLKDMVFNGKDDFVGSLFVFNPRRTTWDITWEQSAREQHFFHQVTWEITCMSRVDIIAMSFEPHTKSPISLLELGTFATSRRMIVFCPTKEGDKFWRHGNVYITCWEHRIPIYRDPKEWQEAVKAACSLPRGTLVSNELGFLEMDDVKADRTLEALYEEHDTPEKKRVYRKARTDGEEPAMKKVRTEQD